MYKDIEFSVSKEFPQYIIKVSQVKKSFHVLVKKLRSKVLVKKQKMLFETIESITKNIYHNYTRDCSNLRYSFLPYFRLVRNFCDYHFHFLVIRRNVQYECIF